jgi:hypothetical protein
VQFRNIWIRPLDLARPAPAAAAAAGTDKK